MNMITIELDANIFEVIIVAIARAPTRPRRHRRCARLSTDGRAFFTLIAQLLPQRYPKAPRAAQSPAARTIARDGGDPRSAQCPGRRAPRRRELCGRLLRRPASERGRHLMP